MARPREPHPRSKRALMLVLLADADRTTTEIAKLTDMRVPDAVQALRVLQRKGLVRLAKKGGGRKPSTWTIKGAFSAEEIAYRIKQALHNGGPGR